MRREFIHIFGTGEKKKKAKRAPIGQATTIRFFFFFIASNDSFRCVLASCVLSVLGDKHSKMCPVLSGRRLCANEWEARERAMCALDEIHFQAHFVHSKFIIYSILCRIRFGILFILDFVFAPSCEGTERPNAVVFFTSAVYVFSVFFFFLVSYPLVHSYVYVHTRVCVNWFWAHLRNGFSFCFMKNHSIFV